MSDAALRPRRNRFRRRFFHFLLLFFSLLVAGELAGFILKNFTISIYDFLKESRPSRAFTSSTKLKILAAGDSYIYGINSNKQARRIIGFPELLETILRTEDGTPATEVINLGLPAADTREIFDRLEHFLSRTSIKPDIVLFSGGMNNLAHWGFYECLVENEMIPQTAFNRFNHFLGRHSFWVRLLMGFGVFFKMHSLAFLTYPPAYDLDADGLRMKNDDLENAIRHCLTADYDRMTQLIQENNAIPILVTYHTGWFITDEQRRFAQTRHLSLVDITEQNKRCTDADVLQFHPSHGEWHPDFQGYLNIAYFVAEVLKPLAMAKNKPFYLAPFPQVKAAFTPLLKPESVNTIKTPCVQSPE